MVSYTTNVRTVQEPSLNLICSLADRAVFHMLVQHLTEQLMVCGNV